MRLLFIAESHGRFMDQALLTIDPTVELMGVWRPGARISGVIELLIQRMHEIIDFDPDFVVMHLGHNDLTPHPRGRYAH